MLISVVMPIYMVEKYIERSLESVLNQTERDFEIILVDDGTKDSSITIAERLLEKSDLKYSIIRQENSGVSAARNAGLKAASGEWVICVDPDDCLHPETFRYLKNIVEKEGDRAEVLAFNYMLLEEGTPFEYEKVRAVDEYDWIEANRTKELYADRTLRLVTPGLCIRRELCEKASLYYNPKIIYSEDTLYIWQVLLNVSGIFYIDTPLYYYIMRPGSTMTSAGIEKICNGYEAYCLFDKRLAASETFRGAEFVLPRWVFGVIHVVSRYMEKTDYDVLLNRLDYRKHMKKLLKHRKVSIRIVSALVLAFGKNAYYFLRI